MTTLSVTINASFSHETEVDVDLDDIVRDMLSDGSVDLPFDLSEAVDYDVDIIDTFR
jgi:hypothetical protein